MNSFPEPRNGPAGTALAAAARDSRDSARRADFPALPLTGSQGRESRRRRLLLIVLVALGFFAVGSLWGDALVSGARRLWHGITGQDDNGQTAEHAAGTFWTCGMHPWVILPEPGLCPICHMELTPLDPAKLTGEIAIDPVTVQNIGVRVAPVTTGPLRKEVRTVGTVTYDEAKVRDVNTKIAGWIEKLYVTEVGAAVKAGEPLFDLYSPELYQTQSEYLQAVKANNPDLQELARTRLRFYDITPEQIAELEKRGEAKKTLTVTSPHTGVVIEKNAHEGMRIDTGTRVFRIADLSTVWVLATFYEYQLPYLKVGQPAVMTLQYLPGERFEGKVTYVYPFLKEQTRQVKARLEFKNPKGVLKPGMFATVRLESTLDRKAVLAPREAVLSTGTRHIAFVSLGEGRFEPRDVRIGAETKDGLVEILEGLKPGEQVVTSAQFLLDSESKVRSALARMVKGQSAADQPAGTSTPVESRPALPAPAAEALTGLLRAYAAAGDRLVANSAEGLAPQAREMVAAMDRLTKVLLLGKTDFWAKPADAAAVREKAAALDGAKGLTAARLTYAELSGALVGLLRETGVPRTFGDRVEVLDCPMFPPKQGGALWVQPAGPARNPYMGEGPMLRCVGERKPLPVAGSGPKAPDSGSAIPAEVQKRVDRLAAAYLALHQLLYKGQVAGADAHLETIRTNARQLAGSGDPEFRVAAEKVAQEAGVPAGELPKLQTAFKSLSAVGIELLERAPPSTSVAPVLRKVHCPMAKAGWLQTAEAVQNPYYGEKSDMADCGMVRGTIAATPPEK